MHTSLRRSLTAIADLEVGVEYAYAREAHTSHSGNVKGPIRRIRITEIRDEHDVSADLLDDLTGELIENDFRPQGKIRRSRIFRTWADYAWGGHASATEQSRARRLVERRDEIADHVAEDADETLTPLLDRIGDLDEITLSRDELLALIEGVEREAWSRVAY